MSVQRLVHQEKETLLARTQEMLNLVSQGSFKIIKNLQTIGKSHSANKLIKTTHLVSATILTLEILVFILQLPYDI